MKDTTRLTHERVKQSAQQSAQQVCWTTTQCLCLKVIVGLESVVTFL